MKRHKVLSLGLLLLAATSVSAQRYMRIWQNGESDRIALSDINYSQGGSVITIGDKTYATSDVDSITMVRTITVNIKDNQAMVNLNNAPGVTYTAEGGHVVINNTNATEEMEFVLSGTSSDASITYNGVYKCKFHLDGLNLTSTKGAALDIQCGKRIDVFLVDGTTNSLTDCAGGLQKAAFYCKGHMEVEGGGSLTVAGYSRHAIGTNEYLILKENTGNITVTNAVNDAIHAGQYFLMDGGTLNITGMAGDGIQAEITNDPTEELNGQLFINGGSINMKVTGNDVKGIKCDADLAITGG
ncbi:MAG: carbohydrate-binding domain-containing protein, partial [Bacteroidaceae bacterium]|nr:carbohydrate-binding domain-containing protein [Bacteroidaceae bacterium]